MAGVDFCESGRDCYKIEKDDCMKEKSKILSKIAYYCFYIAVITEVLIVLVDKSNYTNPVEGRLFQITFLLFLVKVCLTRYTRSEYLAIGLFLGLGAVTYFAADRNEIVRFVMFITACKGIDMKQCLKRVFWLTLAGSAAIILLSITGIYGEKALVMDYGRGGEEVRYTLGMGHPNALQCMIWALTTLGLYLYGNKMKWYHYVCTLLANIIFFLLTDSKTSMIISGFTVVAFLMIPYLKRMSAKLFGIGAIVACAASIAVSVLVAKDAILIWRAHKQGIYDPRVDYYLLLDKLLTGRIISLVGTTRQEGTMQTWRLFSAPENNYYFDMGWVRLFYWYGIIPAIIMIVVLFLFLFYFYKKEMHAELAMVAVFSVYTIVEAHAVSVYLARNYILFLIGMYWCRMLAVKWLKEPKEEVQL